MLIFENVYREHGRALYVFSLRYVKNHADAEEVVQEVFTSLFSQEKTPQHLRAWLFTAARNACLNKLRARRTEQRNVVNLKDHQADLSSELLKEHWISDAVAELPSAARRLFELRAAGNDYQEIANILDVPVGTVKSRMHQMVLTLKGRWKRWNVN